MTTVPNPFLESISLGADGDVAVLDEVERESPAAPENNAFLDSISLDASGNITGYGGATKPALSSAHTSVTDPIAAIRLAAQEAGVDENNLIALAKLETANGAKTIKGGGQDTYNLFNIKDFSKDGSGIRANDKAEGSNDRYRQYSNYLDSARDVIRLLGTNSRYKGALEAKTPEEFATALKRGGYATDENYVSKFVATAGGNRGRAPAANTAQPASTQTTTSGSSFLDQISTEDWRKLSADGSNGIMANAKPEEPKKGRSFGDIAGDNLIGLGKLGPTALKGVAEVGNMLTGDSIDLGVASAMQRGMDSMDSFGSDRFKSDKAGFAAVMQDDTKGVGDMFAYALDNPSILVDNLLPTVGSMFLPAGVAKGAAGAAKALGATAATTQKAAVAASIGAGAAQNAAETFSELKGRSMEERYAGAAVSFAVSALMGIATGGGADGIVAKRMAGDLQAGKVGMDAVKGFLKSIGKEGIQESGEEVGNIAGKALGSDKMPSMEAAKKQVAFAGALGAAMGGGVDIATGESFGRLPEHSAATPDPLTAAAQQPNSPLSRAAVAAGAGQPPATPAPAPAPSAPAADALTTRASAIEALVRGDGKENPGLFSQMAAMDDDAGTGMQDIMDLLATAKNPSAPQSVREHSLQALEAAIQMAGGVVPTAQPTESSAATTPPGQQQAAKPMQSIAPPPQSLDERIASVENLVRGGKTGGQFIEWLRIADPSGGKAQEVMGLLSKAKGRLVPIKTRERAMDSIDSIIEQSRLMAGPQRTGHAPVAVQPAQAEQVAPPQLGFSSTPSAYVVFPDGSVGLKGEAEAYIASLPEHQQNAARAKLLGYGSQPSNTPTSNQSAQVAIPGSDATLTPTYMPGMEINANREKPKPSRVLQPRRRDSFASVSQMTDMATNLDYLQVGPSSVMSSGAPIVFGDIPSNALVGSEQMVTDMAGNHVATRYAIVDARDVIASNNIDGTTVHEYENGLPGKMRAVVGNGRKTAIEHAYKIGAAQAKYRTPLLTNAKSLGIDVVPHAIDSMSAPMLVRIMDESDVSDNLGAVSNAKAGLDQSDVERATNDVRSFDFGSMEFDERGEPTPESVAKFIASLPKNEVGNLVTHDGRITPQAIQRFMAATFKYAYEDDALVGEVTMETDPDAKRVLDAAMAASGVMAALKGTGEFDVSLAVADAIRLAINAKRQGFELANMAQNQDIAISDEGRAVAQMLGNPAVSGSSKRMAEALRRWGMLALQNARIAEENQHQGGLLGPAPTLSRADIFAALGSDANPTEQTVIGREPAEQHQANPVAQAVVAPKPPAQQQTIPTVPTNFSGTPSAKMGTRTNASAGPGFDAQDAQALIKPKTVPQPNEDGLQLNAANKPFSSEGAAKLALRKFGQGRVVPVDGGFAIKLDGAVGEMVRGTTDYGFNAASAQAMVPKKEAAQAVAQSEDRPQAQAQQQAAADTGPIEAAAHEAATSSQNNHPEPTEAQKEAGNYRKGHIRLNGHDISIENPAGTKRSPEWPPLQNHYGYIKGSVGADKDHVDVFLTDRAHDQDLPVFVVDQVNRDGSFDEHKVVMGAADEAEARQTYLGNYEDGWTGLGAITQMSQDEFKAWVRDPKKTKKPLDKKLSPQRQSDKAKPSKAQNGTDLAGEVPNASHPTAYSLSGRSVPLPVSMWIEVGAIANEVENRIGHFAHQPPILIRDTAIGFLPNATSDSHIAGAVHRGKIYLFRDELASLRDVKQTLFHELLHYGLRRFLTKEQFTEKMLDLYRRDRYLQSEADAFVTTPEGEAAAAFGGVDFALGRGVDEALARIAEPNQGQFLRTTSGAVLIRKVTTWLARLAEWAGFPEVAARLRGKKNAEARSYIQSVFQKLREDAPATSGDWAFTATPSFSRTKEVTNKTVSQWQANLRNATTNPQAKEPSMVTPTVLRAMGAKATKLVLSRTYLRAIKEKHPDVPDDVFQNLPAMLADPLFIVAHKHGGLRVFVRAETAQGEPIAVGVSVTTEGRINTVTPLHNQSDMTGQERMAQAVAMATGRIYAKNKEALKQVRASAEAAPGTIPLHRSSSSRTSLITRNDVVKKIDAAHDAGSAAFSLAGDSTATANQPGTSISTIRQSLTQAYGKLVDQLARRGLVTLSQTQEQAIEAAAQARAEVTGVSVEQAKAGLMAGVRNSVAPQRGLDADSLLRLQRVAGIVAAGGSPSSQKIDFGRTPSVLRMLGAQDLPLRLDPLKLHDALKPGKKHNLDASSVVEAVRHLSDPVAVIQSRTEKQAVIVLTEVQAPDGRSMVVAIHLSSDGKANSINKVASVYAKDGLASFLRLNAQENNFLYVNNEKRQQIPEASRLYLPIGADSVSSRPGVGVSEIIRSEKDLGNFEAGIDIKRSANGAVQGFFDPQTGQSFLIADNLSAEAAPGVLMHEVGIHMAADGSMTALFNRAKMLLKAQKGNAFMQGVQAKMDAAGETSAEEVAAYMVEAYENDRTKAPASVTKWLADMLAAVKAWLHNKGILGADSLSVADIAAVARANAKSMARGQSGKSKSTTTNPDASFSRPNPQQANDQTAVPANPFGNVGGIDGFLSIMNAPVQGVSEQLKQEAVANVRATVDAIRATWGNAPDVEVVFDMHDTKIPQKARDADLRQRSRGATGDPEGFYFEGKVYLLASRLPQAGDVARVLIHESVGHYGSHGAFGDALSPILNQIATMRPREVADKAVAYGLYDRSKLQGADPKQVSPAQILEAMSPRQRREAAEEVLATMAQDTPTLGFVRRAIAAIRSWLRNHVPMMDALAMTDEEIINSFILPARAFVERGHTNNDGAGQLQFNRADNAAHDNDSDPGQADDSADTRLAIDDLQRGLEESYQSESVIQGWTSRGILGIAPIAKSFGTEVVGYKVRPEKTVFDTADVGGSNGTRFLGRIYLNASTNRPHLAVLGHEMAHDMRRKQPDLYWQLVEAIRPYIKAQEYSQKFATSIVGRGSITDKMTKQQEHNWIREEFVGEVLSDGFMDRNFWRALGNKNPGLLAEVWGAVSSLLSKVFSKYGQGYTRKTEQYLTDYQKVMQIAGEVMAEYGVANPATDDSSNPSIHFSRTAAAIDASMGALTPAQQQTDERVFGLTKELSLKEQFDSLKANFGLKARQGLVDQFAAIKQIDQRAYMQARMSKASDGALEAALLYGTPFLNDGVPDVKIGNGGFAHVLNSLNGEHYRWMKWVAAHRAEAIKWRRKMADAQISLLNLQMRQLRQVMKNSTGKQFSDARDKVAEMEAEKKKLDATAKELLFEDSDISALKDLDQGNLPNGTSRQAAYAKALDELNSYNEGMLKIALESHLIGKDTFNLMKDQPYVPFYRIMEDEQFQGPTSSTGLTNQKAWEKLKGSKKQLNADLLENMLFNWSHLLQASGRNRAALATMDTAEKMAIAYQVPATTKNAVRVMRDGNTEYWMIEDPYLLEAVGALNYTVSPLMKPLTKMKQILTMAVTVNPTFKIRNLIRDSVSAIAQSELGYDPVANVAGAWKLTASDSQIYASMVAGGGIIKFGTQENTDRLRQQVAKLGGQMLDKMGTQKLMGQMGVLWDAYSEFGDRTENVNRVALYDKLIKMGKSHAEANFMARDLMDFSMGGSWPLVRFLTQTVPFMNARLVGLDKLGRAAYADPRKFAMMAAVVSIASVALMMKFRDDDDWKARDDSDRDSYWWFKIGKLAYKVPKPFELGAIGTMAERTFELMFEQEMTNKRFRERIAHMFSQTFAFDPIPQAVKPLLDVYANKDSFTKRAIETPAEQRMRPQDRYNERTSEVARMLGKMGLPEPSQLIKGDYVSLSPKQIDHLIKGYFSWVRVTAVAAADPVIRPALGKGERPDMRLKDMFVVGNFVESLPTGSSRYVTQMYEQARQINEAYASYREALKSGEVEKAKDIKAANVDNFSNRLAIAHAEDRLSELNQEAKKIEASRTISSEDKRRRLDALSQRRGAIAKLMSLRMAQVSAAN